MKRMFIRGGLLAIFLMLVASIQVMSATSVSAISNPSFDWEESFTNDTKLSSQQKNWCHSNLDDEAIENISSFLAGPSGSYVGNCMDSEIGGLCSVVDDEYQCTLPSDEELGEAYDDAIAAKEVEYIPLQELYCGKPTVASADSLRECQAEVKKAYQSATCYYRNKTDIKNGYSTAKSEAECVFAKLKNNSKMRIKSVVYAQVLAAVKAGRVDSKALETKILEGVANKQQCTKDGGEWTDGKCVLPEEDEGTTCAIEGIGWMICPVVRAIAQFNDALFALLETLLNTDTRMFDTSTGGGKATFQSWSAIRDIANIAFVLAFMIIVYSQLTSAGITNYGIKKLLPRIVVSAILVNLSFVVCAVAVDISNIVGSSLHELLLSATRDLGDDTGANLSNWDALATGLLAGGSTVALAGGATLAVASGGWMGALALLIPLVILALIAALTVVFVLVARQAFIIILIVLAPLAFVAYLLPNTEQWFTRWRKAFVSMLLIYPMIALLFGGSQLASAVIRAGADSALVFILSLIVLVIPLFTTPLLVKFSGGLIGRIAGMINNPNKGPFDRLKKSGANFAERQRNLKMGDAVKRTNGLREGSGGAYGKKGSFRRKGATWLSGIGNANAFDKEQKDTYAKAGADSAKRNYVADRALEPGSDYAVRVGGSEDAANYVKAYAVQAKEEELEKDVKAAQVLLKEQSRTMKSDDYADSLSAKINSKSAAYERVAAIREFSTVANATRLGKLTEDIAELGATDAGSEDTAIVQRSFAATFGGDSRLPSTVSATNKSQMQTGHFSAKMSDRMLGDINGGITLDDTGAVVEQRIDTQTGEVQKGKISKKYFESMDVDEMKDWREAFKNDPKLVNRITAEGKQSVLDAMQQAANDPRLNKGYGPRDYENMEELSTILGGSFTRPTI